ncbi:class I SAM-dependent DNA methyltransferase [Myxococcus faecalis]|uniref:class I SAM-dependent DNA methyltransferase n=1 Tax=Myxococcus faecalis TaxID=3115646 RepID=UPI003CF98D56
MTTAKNDQVIAANIEVHSRLAAIYEKTEPHFRPENVRFVEGRLRELATKTQASKLLDLGCGTGFVIRIARQFVPEIHGVDVTAAMLAQVDRSGPAAIHLHQHDTGTFPAEPGTFDLVTAYSFLHHLYEVVPTLRTAANALRPGGVFYADLDPNYYFWQQIESLERHGDYAPIVRREIEAVAHKDEEMQRTHGIDAEVFSHAEYGKDFLGGFREEILREQLREAGFARVDFHYYWFLGQATLVNAPGLSPEERQRNASLVDETLRAAMPLSRPLYKYVGFTATKG